MNKKEKIKNLCGQCNSLSGTQHFLYIYKKPSFWRVFLLAQITRSRVMPTWFFRPLILFHSFSLAINNSILARKKSHTDKNKQKIKSKKSIFHVTPSPGLILRIDLILGQLHIDRASFGPKFQCHLFTD